MVACFIFLASIPANAANLGQIAYTAAIAFSGLNSVGVIRSGQLVSKYIILFYAKLLI